MKSVTHTLTVYTCIKVAQKHFNVRLSVTAWNNKLETQRTAEEQTGGGWAEHKRVEYSLIDAALEHVEAEQKAMQGRSKRANKAGAGVEDGCVCTVHVCVSGHGVCC